mmetsp:Transcript_42534/g.51840  ORF Transcript_42534/g.51840 Transcript_42534/m.51840 type:complete len:86 (+) Transcript_42534:1017-1274(+)
MYVMSAINASGSKTSILREKIHRKMLGIRNGNTGAVTLPIESKSEIIHNCSITFVKVILGGGLCKRILKGSKTKGSGGRNQNKKR